MRPRRRSREKMGVVSEIHKKCDPQEIVRIRDARNLRTAVAVGLEEGICQDGNEAREGVEIEDGNAGAAELRREEIEDRNRSMNSESSQKVI
jgi:hypothetical protein